MRLKNPEGCWFQSRPNRPCHEDVELEPLRNGRIGLRNPGFLTGPCRLRLDEVVEEAFKRSWGSVRNIKNDLWWRVVRGFLDARGKKESQCKDGGTTGQKASPLTDTDSDGSWVEKKPRPAARWLEEEEKKRDLSPAMEVGVVAGQHWSRRSGSGSDGVGVVPQCLVGSSCRCRRRQQMRVQALAALWGNRHDRAGNAGGRRIQKDG